ncbi:hypothetical protein [Streptomyces zhihengii]|uniref:hypothetical protein n=1 Tax=Streptomyces zhihengii TaxID=1818004 RepID=UPI0033B84132
MNSSSCSKKPAGRVRRGAAVVALALTALVLSAGPSSAGSAGPADSHATAVGDIAAQHRQAGPVHGLPQELAEELCARWEALAAELSLPAGGAPVCKLVNGWD